MTIQTMRLECPQCQKPEALTCKVVTPGLALWVTLMHQGCACRIEDIYQRWNEVWWAAKRQVNTWK